VIIQQAILERWNFVIELVLVDADLEVGEKRNRSPGLENMSCWCTERDTIHWLRGAIWLVMEDLAKGEAE